MRAALLLLLLATACGTEMQRAPTDAPGTIPLCSEASCVNVGLCHQDGVCSCTLGDGEISTCMREQNHLPDAR